MVVIPANQFDPQTGPRRTLRAPGGDEDAAVLLDSEKLAFTPATQKFAVDQAEKDSGLLRLVGQTVPIGSAVGAALVVRGRRRPDTPESSQDPITM